MSSKVAEPFNRLNLRAGETFPAGYHLVKQLGKGLSGDVWLAKDSTGKDVALKFFTNSDFYEHELSSHRSLKPAREKKYVVGLLAYGDTGRKFKDPKATEDKEGRSFSDKSIKYMSFEFMNDGDTWKLRGELSSEQMYGLMVQTLKGLCYLHKNQNAHMDLKPTNIFRHKTANQTRYALGDLGSTCSPVDPKRRCKGCGTQGFTSPEDMRFCKDEIRKGVAYPIERAYKGDVWAMGVTFRLILAKSWHFPSHKKEDVIKYNKEHLRILDPEKVKASGSPELKKLICDTINACLTWDWRVRPSAEDVLKRLMEGKNKISARNNPNVSSSLSKTKKSITTERKISPMDPDALEYFQKYGPYDGKYERVKEVKRFHELQSSINQKTLRRRENAASRRKNYKLYLTTPLPRKGLTELQKYVINAPLILKRAGTKDSPSLSIPENMSFILFPTDRETFLVPSGTEMVFKATNGVVTQWNQPLKSFRSANPFYSAKVTE